MSNKPISFKPSVTDQLLIDALKSNGGFKTNADVIRSAIQQLALVTLDSELYVNTIATGYERDVSSVLFVDDLVLDSMDEKNH